VDFMIFDWLGNDKRPLDAGILASDHAPLDPRGHYQIQLQVQGVPQNWSQL